MSEQGSPDRPNFRTVAPGGPSEPPAPEPGGAAATSPADLGLGVTLLRTVRGWRQEDLARAAGTTKSAVCSVEGASRGFSVENVKGLVEAMGVPFSVLGEAVALVEHVRAGRTERSSRRPAGVRAVAPAGNLPSPPAELAREAARLLESKAHGPTARGRAPRWAPQEARELARGLWQRLQPYGPGERRALVREAAEFQSWALCELLCAESEKAAPRDAEAAVALGGLAVEVAILTLEEEPWRRRLEGYARAFAANAVRAAGKPGAGGEAFDRALAVWDSGAPADPYPLDATRLLDLEASLRRDERRLEESLALLDRALSVHPNGPAAGRLLLKRAKTREELGDYAGAVADLRRAAPQIDAESDPRLPLVLRLNLALGLGYLGRAAEGEELLPAARALAARLGNRPDLLRLRWIEGILAERTGRCADAVAAYEEVRDGFWALRMPYDAALATMQLAVLYAAEGGRTAEVKALAARAAPIFEAEEVHAEARKALGVFRRAAAEERVTVELARGVAAYLERARREPGMRFEGMG